MIDEIARALIVRFGGPKGQPAEYYRQLVIAVLFTFATLMAVVLAIESKFTTVFWCCLLISVTSFVVSTRRVGLLAVLFGFAALRFAFGFVITFRSTMLIATVLCALLAFIAHRSDRERHSAL